MFARLHPIVKICIAVFAVAWVAAFFWAVGRYSTSTTSTEEMVERRSEIKGKASDPVSILPTDNIPGVMPPKPPRPTSGDTDAGYDLADFDRSLAKFVGVEIGQDQAAAQEIIAGYFDPSAQIGSRPQLETLYLPNGLTQIIVTRTNLADDSVAAEQFLAVFKPLTPKTGELTAYGMRIKCYRGANTDQWQTKLCP